MNNNNALELLRDDTVVMQDIQSKGGLHFYLSCP